MPTLKDVRNGPYTVIVRAAEEGGFWAEVVELPGCYSQGETADELREQYRGRHKDLAGIARRRGVP